jgi:Zn-dependent protease
MSSPGDHHDDPLDRLAAEEDWDSRLRAVESDVARSRRRLPRPGRPRAIGFRPARQPGSRVSPIFLALLAVTLGAGGLLWAGVGPASLIVFVFVLAGWLVTLCLHEFAHALTAHHGGDDTVAGKGYLTLDPRRYGHPVLTFVLPLLFLIIGGLPLPGGAVMIESHRLRNRFRDALVSAAGPAVNVVAAVLLLATVSLAGPEAIFYSDAPQAAFWAALTFLAYLQVASALLNLIPMPGLDGYGIIEPYLPDSIRRVGRQIRPYGILILFALLYLPLLRNGFSATTNFFVDVAGAPINGVYYGYSLFQFWR